MIDQSQTWIPSLSVPSSCSNIIFNASYESTDPRAGLANVSVSSSPAWLYRADLTAPGTYTVKLKTCIIKDQTAAPYYAGGDLFTTTYSGPICISGTTDMKHVAITCSDTSADMFPSFTMESFTVATPTAATVCPFLPASGTITVSTPPMPQEVFQTYTYGILAVVAFLTAVTLVWAYAKRFIR